ncbi:MAG: MmgE/PrpD family protein, partial [Candidatus Rokuibacteriota bacterium]
HATFLAMRGITGPREVFEGTKGFMEAIAGPFDLAWDKEDLERVTRTIVKRYNAEIHGQAAIEALLELAHGHGVGAADVEAIEVDIFDVAYHIIGGGEEGDKTVVRTKEEADHSLQYILAVALLDGQVMPEQYAPERIRRDDVQALLRRVVVRPDPALSRRFPAEHACRVTLLLRDGRRLKREKADYEGFHTRPMSWETVSRKFERLGAPHADGERRRQVIDAVAHLEDLNSTELTRVLAAVRAPPDDR